MLNYHSVEDEADVRVYEGELVLCDSIGESSYALSDPRVHGAV